MALKLSRSCRENKEWIEGGAGGSNIGLEE